MRCGTFLEAAGRLGSVDVLAVPITDTLAPEDVLFTRAHAQRLAIVESAGRKDSLMTLVARAEPTDQLWTTFQAMGRPMICGNQSQPVLHDAAAAVSGERYDLCVVMRLYTLPILEAVARSATIARVVCDLDDDDAQLSRDLAGHAREMGDGVSARRHEIEATQYAAFRERMARLAELLTVAGPDARRTLSGVQPGADLRLVRNGIAIPRRVPHTDSPDLLFVGTLNYRPNEDGLMWFLSEVLPLIRAELPQTRLRIVGRLPSRRLAAAARSARVILSSDIDDIAEAYETAALAIVPILAGSGTRIKILEAGAFGVAVIATEKGAEGLGLEDGVHAVITPADPDAFAAACISTLRDGVRRRAMTGRLRAHVAERYERGKIVDRIAEILAEAMTRRR